MRKGFSKLGFMLDEEREHILKLIEKGHSDEEIAKRKAGWVAPKPRYTRGVQAKFAFNASTASKGAVLDNF